ncbi:class I SAM-dependent DNA methyltransferase [Spirochaeta africana]|nr:class I SAM-dependent methyltransferase [Spirochaeta africana]
MQDGSAAPYSLFARYYDLAWAEYAGYCRDLILAAEESALRPLRRVCDAACGTGVLLELLQDEWQVTAGRELMGFDLSPQMLRQARTRLPGVPLRQADVRDPFPFPGPIDLVTCMHDSLNYLLDPEDLAGFFYRVRRVLAPDGVLICDLNTPDLYRYGADRTAAGNSEDYLLQGQRIRETMRYDEQQRVGITRLEFPEGIEEHRQRAWSPPEVVQLLRESGLHPSDMIEVEEEPDGYGAPRPSGKMVYVAVKA